MRTEGYLAIALGFSIVSFALLVLAPVEKRPMRNLFDRPTVRVVEGGGRFDPLTRGVQSSPPDPGGDEIGSEADGGERGPEAESGPPSEEALHRLPPREPLSDLAAPRRKIGRQPNQAPLAATGRARRGAHRHRPGGRRTAGGGAARTVRPMQFRFADMAVRSAFAHRIAEFSARALHRMRGPEQFWRKSGHDFQRLFRRGRRYRRLGGLSRLGAGYARWPLRGPADERQGKRPWDLALTEPAKRYSGRGRTSRRPQSFVDVNSV